MPSEWLASDLGVGEIAVIALALENPDRVVLLEDMLARRTAQGAGLQVWGTLKILLEAKSHVTVQIVVKLGYKCMQSVLVGAERCGCSFVYLP